MVSEEIKRQALYGKVRSIVKEELYKAHRNIVNEDDSMEIKRKTVMNLLKDEKYKDSSLAYDLWKPKDQSEKDTFRSLFSKKATGEPDADGNVRHFTDEEITKLYELLRKK